MIGKIVIGEGALDEAPMLYTGEILGTKKGLGITRGPFLCLKFGRSGRIRTPGHWFWRPALWPD